MTNKKKIKIKFLKSVLTADRQEFIDILNEGYDWESSDNPDYVVYSDYDYEHLDYDCVRIFYTGECYTPNFNECDYAVGFDRLKLGDRYMRIPLYNLFQYRDNYKSLKNRLPFTQKELSKKTGFCNFVVSNCFATDVRSIFFDKLNLYKRVDSGGRYKNNIGGTVGDKMAFQKNYKFSIAFENCSYPGYCTEKIMEAFAARTIPIYYGDPEVAKDFNPKAFINAHDYDSLDAVVARVKEIDENDVLYLAMINEPIIQADAEVGSLETFLKYILDQDIAKAYRRSFSRTPAFYEGMQKRHRFFEMYIYRYYQKVKNQITRLKTGTLLSSKDIV